MIRLNIPLSSNHRTRRHRRVLWLIIFWSVSFVLVLTLMNIWFTRDTLSSFAPEDSTATIHFPMSSLAWTKLVNDFGNFPLISERPLTLLDLAKLNPKEISLFLLANGESAVALRVNGSQSPKDLWTAYGINVQNLGQNRWLLSNEPLPFVKKGTTLWSFSFFKPKTIGKINLKNFSGHIFVTKSGYKLEIPKTKITGQTLPFLPENTLAGLSLQKNQNLETLNISQQIDLLLAPLGPTSKDLLKQMEENNGSLILVKVPDSPKKIDFLLETKLGSDFFAQLTKTIASFQNPTLKPLKMPDGSIAQEIFVDPTDIAFGQQWIGGQEVKSLETPNGKILTLDSQKTNIIASNSVLLEEFLAKNQEKNFSTCGSSKPILFLSPKEITNFINNNDYFITKPSLLNFLSVFQKISLEQNSAFFCY